ncbi:MAG: hypothetical protein M5U28_32715 [Sandaracinaceae bacterium]|nr:hypothetical protein [Sandaracinaceae bacterium]
MTCVEAKTSANMTSTSRSHATAREATPASSNSNVTFSGVRMTYARTGPG